MKTIVTIAEDQNVLVERYEENLKVGERNVAYSTLIKTLLDEAGIDFILRYIVTNHKKVSNMLQELHLPHSNKTPLISFIEMLIENLTLEDIKDKYQGIGIAILKKLKVTEESDFFIEQLLHDYYAQKYSIANNPTSIELTKKLMRLLVRENETETQQLIIQEILVFFNQVKEKEELEKWFRFVLKNIDKKVLIEEAQAVIQRSQGNMNFGFTTLPKNCVGVSMNDIGPIYVLEVPKAQIRVRLFDIPFEAVGHPRLLFIVQFNKRAQQVVSIKCAAIKEHAQINEQLELYKYPYSNVYENGKVCWSGYPTDFESIGMLPNLFLAAANNGHLVHDIRGRFERNTNCPFEDNQLESMNMKLKNLY